MAKSNETKSSEDAESFKCDQCDKVSNYTLSLTSYNTLSVTLCIGTNVKETL